MGKIAGVIFKSAQNAAVWEKAWQQNLYSIINTFDIILRVLGSIVDKAVFATSFHSFHTLSQVISKYLVITQSRSIK